MCSFEGVSSKQSGSRVLYILQFLKNSGGAAIQNAIAIVESASDEGGV